MKRATKPIEPMQAFFEASLQRQPKLQVRRILDNRVREAGLSFSEEELDELTEKLLAGEVEQIGVAGRTELQADGLKLTTDDLESLAAIGPRLNAAIPGVVNFAVKSGAAALLRGLRRQWPDIRGEHEADREAFAATIALIWGDALDKLDLLLATADTIGDEALGAWRRTRSPNRLVLGATLERLHTRGCQVGQEILTLLNAGFADAALARWRTLHEITVVATILRDNGGEVAARYLDHDLIEQQRAAEEFERCHPTDAAKRSNRQALAETKAASDAAIAHYGPEFRNEYGWAAKALGIGKPTFRQLEQAADQAHMRLQYKLASYGVHAGSKGVTTSLADLFGDGPPGAASIAGLNEAGIQTAFAIVRLTELLIGPRWSIDKLAKLKTLVALRDATTKSFRRSGRAMGNASWLSEDEIKARMNQASSEQLELDVDAIICRPRRP